MDAKDQDLNYKNRFSVILADPPWPYNSRSHHSKTRFGGGVHNQYKTMSIADIKKISVSAITTKNAVLFCWATFPHLENALEVISAWGFRYKTLGFSWTKTYPKQTNKLFFGTGFYSKSNTEICLLATKGKTLIPATNRVSSAIVSPILRHSAKPVEVHRRIEALYPSLPKAELFARNLRPNWTCLGNEIDGLDINIAIERLNSQAQPTEVGVIGSNKIIT